MGHDTDVYNQILKLAKEGLPYSAFIIIEDALIQMTKSSLGASIVGFSILFFSASHAFAFLSRSLDKIWQVQKIYPHQQNVITIISTYIQYRFFAFLLLLGSSGVFVLLILFDIANKIFINLLENVEETKHLVQAYENFWLGKVQAVHTFLILFLIVMIVFKFLPSTKIKWGDIWLGSLLTAIILFLLQKLVSNSFIVINITRQFQYYGVIGGVMVLLLWIYLTCEIFFLGSEFTYIYAQLFGSRRHQ